MSTFGRPLTDDGLIRVLDHWLDDGPVVAPDLMVESALRTAARTPQRRWRGRLLRFAGASPLVPVGLTLAAVAAVVALGAGLGQVLPLPGTEATPTPARTDTPTPDASSPPSGWVVYTNEEDGYELTLPAALAATAQQPQDSGNPVPGVRGFGVGERSVYAVAISVGQPDGSITLCGVTESNGYSGTNCDSVTVTSLDELEELLISTADASLGDSEYHADTSLGGLPARVEAIRPGGMLLGPLAFHHVYAIHDGRPIVVSFDQWTLRNHLADSARGGILASFRLLESDNPASGWVTYTNEEDGYELTLPARWTPTEFFSNPRGTMRFGGAHSDGDPSGFGALTVSIGSTDGTVYDCAPSLCRQIVATTVDELDAAIENDSIVVETPMITTVDVDVTLDGEPARLEYVTFAAGLIEQGAQFHHLFAIHDGRPVVLSFDKYAYGIGRQSNDIRWVESLIQGFRFLDRHESPTPSPDDSDQTAWKTVELANVGLAVDIPSDWVVDAAVDPTLVTIRGTSGSVQVRAGDQSGHISTCLVLAPCQLVEARSMDDLIGVARGEYRVRWGLEPTMKPTVRDQRVILDGVAAARVTISPPGPMTGPGTERYLVFIRNERAVILQWGPVFSGPGLWDEIIASIRFID